MTTSLQSLQHIQTVSLVKWKIYEYREQAGDFPNEQTFYFNDSIRDMTISYSGFPVTSVGLGPLMNFSRTKESIRAKGDKVTIGLSGVPDYEVKSLLASNIKGSEIQIDRLLEYPGTNDSISDLDYFRASGGIVGRFFGFVNNYTINDDIQHSSQVRLVEVVLDCFNFTGLYSKQVAGLKTNPQDLRYWSTDDAGFDNVPALVDQDWFFGESK